MKIKSRCLVTMAMIATAFIGCISTQKSLAAEASSFQMRLVTEVAGGDCDCDDMLVVSSPEKKELVHVLHKVWLDQGDLKSAKVGTDNLGRPEIEIAFNAEGAKRFAELTRNNIDKKLAIILDGKLYSAPVIRTEIPSGRAVISGNFSKEEAKELVAKLNGALKK